MPDIIIGGLTPLSSVDYPDQLAAVLFCQGCPWACPYCQNAALRPVTGQGAHTLGEVLDWLGGRRGLLDAVVFSGGEPTLQAGLGAAMDAARRLGFRVGLHTAGMFPEALGTVLGRCDWVGLDIKAPLTDYDRLTGRADSGQAAFASLKRLQSSGVAFEIRTTWHPALLDAAALERLAKELDTAGAAVWMLQAFQPNDQVDPDLAAAGTTPVPPDLLARLRAIAPRLTIACRD